MVWTSSFLLRLYLEFYCCWRVSEAFEVLWVWSCCWFFYFLLLWGDFVDNYFVFTDDPEQLAFVHLWDSFIVQLFAFAIVLESLVVQLIRLACWEALCRWFCSQTCCFSSLVRWLWNVATLSQLLFLIPGMSCTCCYWMKWLLWFKLSWDMLFSIVKPSN